MKNIKTYEEFEEVVTFKEYLNKYKIESDTEIYCTRSNLIDLNGIEKYSNMIYLDCSHNKLSSLEPIKNLTKLKILIGSYNKITSLKGLENLTNLSGIYLFNNLITSLDSIKNLTNITILSCGYNEITSLKGIENLTKLTTVYCHHNPIDWIDYIDKKGNTWYTVLPKSITVLDSDNFSTTDEYWEFMEKNQPASASRKFNF